MPYSTEQRYTDPRIDYIDRYIKGLKIDDKDKAVERDRLFALYEEEYARAIVVSLILLGLIQLYEN